MATIISITDATNRARQDKEHAWTPVGLSSLIAGGLSFVGIKAWSAFDAAESARRYNQRKAQEKEKKGAFRFLWDSGRFQLAYIRRF